MNIKHKNSSSINNRGLLFHSFKLSSLLPVTAPSSPLSPPTSPSLTASELPPAGKNGECTICFDQEVDAVIYTCGHMCLCNDCGQKLKRQINACCPICRRPIKDVIKTYRPWWRLRFVSRCFVRLYHLSTPLRLRWTTILTLKQKLTASEHHCAY